MESSVLSGSILSHKELCPADISLECFESTDESLRPDGAKTHRGEIQLEKLFHSYDRTVKQVQTSEEKANSNLAVTRLQVAEAVDNYVLTALAARQAAVAAEANVSRGQTFNQSVHALVDNDLRPGADASGADAELAFAMLNTCRPD